MNKQDLMEVMEYMSPAEMMKQFNLTKARNNDSNEKNTFVVNVVLPNNIIIEQYLHLLKYTNFEWFEVGSTSNDRFNKVHHVKITNRDILKDMGTKEKFHYTYCAIKKLHGKINEDKELKSCFHKMVAIRDKALKEIIQTEEIHINYLFTNNNRIYVDFTLDENDYIMPHNILSELLGTNIEGLLKVLPEYIETPMEDHLVEKFIKFVK